MIAGSTDGKVGEAYDDEARWVQVVDGSVDVRAGESSMLVDMVEQFATQTMGSRTQATSDLQS